MKISIKSDSSWFSVFSFIINLWCSTFRFEEVYENSWNTNVSGDFSKKPKIVAIWHDEFLPLAFFYRKKGIYTIVSPSRDGEILAGFLKRWGYNLLRGSSHKRPVKLLKEVISEVKSKDNIIVTIAVDGPTGPRHKVKKGAIYLAYRLGAYILPIRVIIQRSIKLNSWDRFQIPVVGSKCKIVYGEPYLIDINLKRISKGVDLEAVKLENKLEKLEQNAI